MKIISFDPGALRMGYAVLETRGAEDVITKAPVLLGYGCLGFKQQDDETYQQHRLNLISFWVERAPALFREHQPDELVNEILPVVGFKNSVNAQLGASAMTTVQAMATQAEIPVCQIGASTIKKRVGGHGKATKVKVRNGVYEWLPDTRNHHEEWKKAPDITDAIAVGITRLLVVDKKKGFIWRV